MKSSEDPRKGFWVVGHLHTVRRTTKIETFRFAATLYFNEVVASLSL